MGKKDWEEKVSGDKVSVPLKTWEEIKEALTRAHENLRMAQTMGEASTNYHIAQDANRYVKKVQEKMEKIDKAREAKSK